MSKPRSPTNVKRAQVTAQIEQLRKSRPPKAKRAAFDPHAPVTEVLGIPLHRKLHKPKGRKHKSNIEYQPTTPEQSKTDVVAEEEVSGTGNPAKREAGVLTEAGLMGPEGVLVPEVLPAVPEHPALSGPPDELRRTTRRARALLLRIQGLDYRDIRDALIEEGYTRTDGKKLSVKTVFYDVKRSLLYLARIETGLAEDVRNLELHRLDYMQSALAKDIDRGDTYAIAAALAIMKHRADLLGLRVQGASSSNGGLNGARGEGAGQGDSSQRPLAPLTDTELRKRLADRAKALGVTVPAEWVETFSSPTTTATAAGEPPYSGPGEE